MQEWLKKPIRDVHLTIRERDVIAFDVSGFIDDMERLHANIVTFYIGGYGAHYPTNVKNYPRNPFIGDRDLVKEIDEEAHRRGILIGTCIDAGNLVEEVAKAHPNWLAIDENGNPRVVTTQHGKVYANCINTGYVRDVIPEILREHLTLHNVDLINLTDFSFHGFCHCSNCRRDFKAETGYEIPLKPDWSSPIWQAFMNWRVKTLSAIWDRTFKLVKEISPNTATMGNNVLDLVNMRNSAHDLDFLKDVEDVIKTEAQTRVQYIDIDLPMKEEPFQWPAEEVRYLRTITHKPSLTSSNYGYTWPWRRAALPPRLQKLWLSEVIANGGNMFVHIGGQPAVQEDRRGLSAIADMFGWVEKHEQYYQDAEAYTDLAIVLSQNTLLTYCGENTENRYVNHLRGLYAALNQAHINFNIISEKFLNKEALSKYRAIMLTNHACMSNVDAQVIRDYVASGGHVVATYESSLYDEKGAERENFALADVFGVDFTGTRLGPISGTVPPHQRVCGYFYIDDPESPIVEGIGDTVYILNGGYALQTTLRHGATCPVTIVPPFEIFPEARAYTWTKRTDLPGIVVNRYGKGSCVYITGQTDKLFLKMKHPDLRKLLVNALRIGMRAPYLSTLKAPTSVDIAVQWHPGKRFMYHVINLTAPRPQDESIPVYDLKLGIRVPQDMKITRAFALSDGRECPIDVIGGETVATLDKLDEYDIVVFE